MRRFYLTTLAALALCPLLTPRAAAQTYAERIATGFSQPMFGTYPPGDANRLFVGRIWMGRIEILDLVSRSVLPTPFLVINDMPDPLLSYEQGMLGMAFDPDYATNGYFYVDYTRVDNSIEVRRFRVLGDPATSNVADPDSGQTVINIPKGDTFWHNAGWISFGPNDGYLYVNVGDPGGGQAQDITDNLQGKILRLDVRSDDFPQDPLRNYAIPPSNPFVGTVGDDEIWAYGLRNPWRASFDPVTGDLWINDVGEVAREEVNFQPANSSGGENYGWPRREGTVIGPNPYGGPLLPEYSQPIYDYARNPPDPLYGGTVIAASGLYRGPVDAFYGHYLFTDYGSQNIWMLDPDAIDPRASVININDRLLPDAGARRQIASFGRDAAGNFYLMEVDLDGQGDVFRVATTSKDAVWNGNDAAAGAAGDGIRWGDANNWSRDAVADAAFVAADPVIFSAGSSQTTIDLERDRTVAAVTFTAPYSIENHVLKVLSGNVTVENGVTAIVRSDLVAETVNRSIRKLGGGTLFIEGNAGQISVKAGTLGGTGTVDHLTVRDGGTVSPGAPTGILAVDQSFTMHEGATLAIEIGGRDNSDPLNPQFDQLFLGGGAKLNGSLAVKLTDLGGGAFEPVRGDSFLIMVAADGITGSFDTLQLPALKTGLVWQPLDMGTLFFLKVASRLPGDYNGNGIVDAADYVVWRNTLGNTGGSLAADGSGLSGFPDGIVDQFDYYFWRANFGKTASGPASSASVPEPDGAIVISFAGCILLACSRARMKWQ